MSTDTVHNIQKNLTRQWRRRVLLMWVIELCVIISVWSAAEQLFRIWVHGNQKPAGSGLEFFGVLIIPGVLGIGAGLLVSVWLKKKLRITELKHRIELAQPKNCPKCGYSLVPGGPDDAWAWFCPECGSTYDANGKDA